MNMRDYPRNRPLIVHLGLPDACLNPNSRKSWQAKIEPKAALRAEAAIKATNNMGNQNPPRWGEATIDIVYHHRSERRRDPDNFLAMLKPAFDGLVDAGVLADDNKVTYLPVQFRVSKTFTEERVNLTIWETKRETDGT